MYSLRNRDSQEHQHDTNPSFLDNRLRYIQEGREAEQRSNPRVRTSYEDLETACGTWFETTNAPLNATAKTNSSVQWKVQGGSPVCPKGQALLPLAVLNFKLFEMCSHTFHG